MSRFHFRLCRYFLGHVACRNLPWQGLLIGRRESKEKSTEKMNWCQERERIEMLLSSLENKEKSAGKMNWSQARERTELLFNRQEYMLPAQNVEYSIPVCKEIKAREK